MASKKAANDTRRVRKIFLTDSAIGFVVLLLFLWLTNMLSHSRTYQLFGDIVNRVETQEKVVALTFDDGPLPRTTGKLLEILDRNQAKATFYLIGNEIERHPNEARAIVQAGHELGNHTYNHYPMVFLSSRYIKDDIEKTDAIFKSVGYHQPTTFRPPYGVKLAQLPFYLSRNDRTTVMWDVAPDDEPEVAASAERITVHTIEHVKPGSIIILHPLYDHRKPSLDAVEPIIQGLRQKGYKFVTVSELLLYRN